MRGGERGLGAGRAGGGAHPAALRSSGREQARLKGGVVEEDTEEWQKEPSFAGLERVGGVDLSYVKGDDSRACASLVVLSYPGLEVTASERLRSARWCPGVREREVFPRKVRTKGRCLPCLSASRDLSELPRALHKASPPVSCEKDKRERISEVVEIPLGRCDANRCQLQEVHGITGNFRGTEGQPQYGYKSVNQKIQC